MFQPIEILYFVDLCSNLGNPTNGGLYDVLYKGCYYGRCIGQMVACMMSRVRVLAMVGLDFCYVRVRMVVRLWRRYVRASV